MANRELEPDLNPMNRELAAGRWQFAFVPFVVGICFYPAIFGEYVWDDTLILVDSARYRVADSLVSAVWSSFSLSPNYFRPLGVLSFVLELRFWGLGPLPPHLLNVALHALNSLLVALLFRRLKPSRPLSSLAAGLLYGLHPALLETVAFVSCRFDLLVCTWLLIFLLVDSLELESVAGKTAMAAGAFLMAALSKEMAVCMLLVLPLWHWAVVDPRSGGRQIFYRVAPAWAGAVLGGIFYLAFRFLALGQVLPQPGAGAINVRELLSHTLLIARSMATYATLVLWPFTSLSPLHVSPLPVPETDPWVWGEFGLCLVGGLFLVWWGIRSWRRPPPRAAFLVAAGIAGLAPVVNLLPLELGGGAIVAERFLTFPLTLLVMGVTLMATQLLSRRVGLLLLTLWLAGSVFTIRRTLPHWQDEESLWSWAVERAPGSPLGWTNLALEATRRGENARAIELSEKAIMLDPKNANALDNKGVALFHLGRVAEAEVLFRGATDLEPGNLLYWNNLAAVIRDQGRVEEAEQILFSRVLDRDPGFGLGHLNLGILYLQAQRPDLAEAHLVKAAQTLPPRELESQERLLGQARESRRWLKLGDAFLNRGDSKAAVAAFRRSHELGAPEPDFAVGLGAALVESGHWQEARVLLESAIRRHPKEARLWNNLGMLELREKRLLAAKEMFLKAMALAPEWDGPRHNLALLERLPGGRP